ncbi:YceI family protein [Roseobacteraceae bacterium S113]
MKFLLLSVSLLIATATTAAPKSYDIDRSQSDVSFSFSVLGAETRARAPVGPNRISLDFADISRSVIDVTVETKGARTAVPFVAETMKSPQILDVKNHPEARFVASSIRLRSAGDFSKGAVVDGTLTIKGISRPVTFDARLTRARGSDPTDLSDLVISVSGQIDRRTYGITSFADAVGPNVEFQIKARLLAQ